jgi:TrmH family RNA methyltransferase
LREIIKSPHNPSVKELRKLQDRKHRDRTGLFVAEGEDMLTEALKHGVHPEELFYDPQGPADPALLDDLPADVARTPVDADVLARAGSLGSGTRMIGVWRQPWAKLPAGPADGASAASDASAALDASDVPEVYVYLHEVADPGNVGAVLRSASAFASSAVVVSPQTADPFGPKAVRASMGAVFAVPVARATFEQASGSLGPGYRAVALAPRAGRPLRDVDLGGRVLFVLGSERAGLPESIMSSCTEIAHVPLRRAGAESLNVAMAATLCLYEFSLHRLSRSDG